MTQQTCLLEKFAAVARAIKRTSRQTTYHRNTKKIYLTKRREELLPEIAEEFVTQYKLFKGITNVTITTATPLNDAALAEIKAKLLASDITAKELEITQKVNPELLGGFVIEVGDKLFDNSISFKLNKLSKQFKSKDFIKAI